MAICVNVVSLVLIHIEQQRPPGQTMQFEEERKGPPLTGPLIHFRKRDGEEDIKRR